MRKKCKMPSGKFRPRILIMHGINSYSAGAKDIVCTHFKGLSRFCPTIPMFDPGCWSWFVTLVITNPCYKLFFFSFPFFSDTIYYKSI